MKLTAYGETFDVTLRRTRYTNNSLAITLDCDDGIPYGVVTVNLDDPSIKPNEAYIDVNNSSKFEQFVIDNGLGQPTGEIRRSGYVKYPLYSFDLDKLPKEDEYEEYEV